MFKQVLKGLIVVLLTFFIINFYLIIEDRREYNEVKTKRDIQIIKVKHIDSKPDKVTITDIEEELNKIKNSNDVNIPIEKVSKPYCTSNRDELEKDKAFITFKDNGIRYYCGHIYIDTNTINNKK